MSKDCNKCRRGNANTMTAPAPDTSPGDEINKTLVLFSKKLSMVQGEYNAGLKLSEVQRHAEEAQAEAKDRLNRLMLTEQKRELQQLVADTLTPENVGGHFIHDEVKEFAKQQKAFINERIKAIDAQLHKEETDGDIPGYADTLEDGYRWLWDNDKSAALEGLYEDDPVLVEVKEL